MPSAVRPAPDAKPSRCGWFGGFVFGLLLGAFGTLFAVPFFLAPIWRAATSLAWTATPCTIVSSEVEAVFDDEGGPTYRVAVAYTYAAPGPGGGPPRAFTGHRYGFGDGGTIGRGSKQRLVDANPAGARRTCFVDPSDPSSAVLSRAIGLDILLASFTLLFPLIGFGIASFAWRSRTRRDPSLDGTAAWASGSARPRLPWGLLVLALGALCFDLILLAVYVELLTPPYEHGSPDWGPIFGLSPFLLIGLYVFHRLLSALLAAFRGRAADATTSAPDGPDLGPEPAARPRLRDRLAAPPARPAAAPSYYARLEATSAATSLFRVVEGRADQWKAHGWAPVTERDPRVLREHALGLDLFDRVPQGDVWKHQIAVGRRFRTRTVGLWLRTPAPLSLAQVAERLDGVAGPWTEGRLPGGRATLDGAVTSDARARIRESGHSALDVNLTVHAATEAELGPLVEEAKEHLVAEVLPLLGPVELRATVPFEETA